MYSTARVKVFPDPAEALYTVSFDIKQRNKTIKIKSTKIFPSSTKCLNNTTFASEELDDIEKILAV